MRYVILPILSIIYLWWAFLGIKVLFLDNKLDPDSFDKAFGELYLFLHALLLLASIIFLTVKYW